MNYRELLQKYKAGELPEEQRKQVRQDIEKQDAISEYLFDNEEMEFEEQVEQDGGQTTESTWKCAERRTKRQYCGCCSAKRRTENPCHRGHSAKRRTGGRVYEVDQAGNTPYIY